MHRVLEQQNNPVMIALLKASTVAYTHAKKWEQRILLLFLTLSIAYPVSYLFVKNETFKLGLFGCSFILAIAIQIFSSALNGNTTKGADFKELFDTLLFGLPWKSTLSKPDEAQIQRYAASYKGPDLRDWYSTNLSPFLPETVLIAALQRSNTHWDIALRRKYRAVIRWYLIGYTALLAIAMILFRADFITIFLLLFSLLAFYIFFISLIRGHSHAIRKRMHISSMLDELLFNRKEITLGILRDIQDEIYFTRQETAKVPNFFFQLHKDLLSRENEDFIQKVNAAYQPVTATHSIN